MVEYMYILLELSYDGAELFSEDIVDVDENIMILWDKYLAKQSHIELSNRNSRLKPCLVWSTPVVLQGLTSREGMNKLPISRWWPF